MDKKILYKGCLEPIILKLLQEHKKMYGYEITQKVKLLTEGNIVITEGALYPLLHRLEAEEILTVSMENIGNRVRKYYSLTKKGKVVQKSALSELENFIKTLQILTQPAKSI